MPTPLLIVGDAPNLPTGLSRIAREIAAGIHRANTEGRLDVHLAQLGWGHDGSPWPWPVYPVHDEANWGKADIARVWDWHSQGQDGVVFTIWDPARCFATIDVELNAARWGYFAIDGENPKGKVGGPAASTLGAYDRVLAYGHYGAGVIKKTLVPERNVQWLPHGIDINVFHPTSVGTDEVNAVMGKWRDRKGGHELPIVIGCVAANQPRKDLSLLFDTADFMRSSYSLDVRLWLNIDVSIKDWSVPELAEVYGWNNDDLLVTTNLPDQALAYLYSLCDVTIAPGLGEGFGYPIVESLACGTPVIHGNYGGGAELLPSEWLVDAETYRYEGCYLVMRPVYLPGAVGPKVHAAVTTLRGEPKVTRAACTGMVSYLDWRQLWPRWESWIRRGLEDGR